MNSLPHTTCRTSPRAGHSGMRYASELLVGVVLVCITLHTFFLAGLIVPVTVSGGSMAETLLGPRREVVCPHCGITFACGHERLPDNGRAVCLNCYRSVDLNDGRDWPGERALIDRASLSFRPPRRWEVIVFRCPEQADTYCIKRIVGLPGESIQIREGDVYIEGTIARKNLAECRAVAQLVHDATFLPKTGKALASPPNWDLTERNPHWNSPILGKFEYSFPPTDAQVPSASREIEWLEFHGRAGKPIQDDDSYNQSESRRLNNVTDLMLSCKLTLSGVGELTIRSDVDNDQFELHLNPSRQTCSLDRQGQARTTVSLAENTFAQPTRLEVIRFDQQILLAIGGNLVLAHRYDPLPNVMKKVRPSEDKPLPEDPWLTPPAWAIGATSLTAEITQLRVLRDIYYTVPAPGHNTSGVRSPVLLSDDEYFVLGDNSPISADSRIQAQPGIPRKLLIGRLLTTW